MSDIFQRVKDKAHDANWSSAPFKGFVAETPSETFNDIVSMAFVDVNNTWNHAKHSRYDEMYKPHLGTFRERKMYTSLAPSLCIPYRNRGCTYQQTPHKAYLTKQSEWLVERDRDYRVRLPRNPVQLRATSEPPAAPLSRRTFTKPTSTTRVDNHFMYWRGRVSGLDYIAPFLQPEDWRPNEDRRYNRMYWASQITDSLTPSCRHATNFMLSAY